MAIIDILRNGVSLANTVLKSVQADVQLRAWTGQDGKGKAIYAAPVTLSAIVDLTRKQRYTTSGALVTVAATVTFLEPVPPNGASGRREPIDPRDIIILPDGTTGPILDVPRAVWDPPQNRPLLNEVMLGDTGIYLS